MPKYNAKDLLDKLEADVRELLKRLEPLAGLNSTALNTQPAPGKWSIAQVLEHLNSYNRYYLPQIEKALQKGRQRGIKAKSLFNPGIFGNYFTKIMLPGADGKIGNKMNAPKDHQPPEQLDAKAVINEFREGSERLIDFLQQGRHMDIGKLKVPISISRFLKLKLGDTFRFLVAHQQRHFIQIDRVVSQLSIYNEPAETAIR